MVLYRCKKTSAQAVTIAFPPQPSCKRNQSMVSLFIPYLQLLDDGVGVLVGLGRTAKVTGDGLGRQVSIGVII